MENSTKVVRDYYDQIVEQEWGRIENRPEFLLTCRMLDRYIKSGDKVLDIGGGPGRYSLYLADKGCDVTLFDLSEENTKFAMEQATQQGLSIRAIAGDARDVDKLIDEQFDYVLLMGPLYHLLEESDRVKAMEAALKLLKPGGVIFASFINAFAGLVFGMKYAPEQIDPSLQSEAEYLNRVVARKSYAGDAFTKAFFINQNEILPFMEKFPLEKLHLFGQEGILSPCEANIMSQPQEIISLWLDYCEKIWEFEEYFSWSEHLMYVGRKT